MGNEMKCKTLLIRFFLTLLVCLSGCVSSSKYEALKSSYQSYVIADEIKKKAIEKHFLAMEDKAEEHERKPDLLLQLQMKGLNSWQKRINKAKKGLELK